MVCILTRFFLPIIPADVLMTAVRSYYIFPSTHACNMYEDRCVHKVFWTDVHAPVPSWFCFPVWKACVLYVFVLKIHFNVKATNSVCPFNRKKGMYSFSGSLHVFSVKLHFITSFDRGIRYIVPAGCTVWWCRNELVWLEQRNMRTISGTAELPWEL